MLRIKSAYTLIAPKMGIIKDVARTHRLTITICHVNPVPLLILVAYDETVLGGIRRPNHIARGPFERDLSGPKRIAILLSVMGYGCVRPCCLRRFVVPLA